MPDSSNWKHTWIGVLKVLHDYYRKYYDIKDNHLKRVSDFGWFLFLWFQLRLYVVIHDPDFWPGTIYLLYLIVVLILFLEYNILKVFFESWRSVSFLQQVFVRKWCELWRRLSGCTLCIQSQFLIWMDN